jgi:two-component system, NtrC family, response regulator AtoC
MEQSATTTGTARALRSGFRRQLINQGQTMKAILIADDYIPFLQEMETTLAGRGFVVRTASSMAAALARLKAEKYDLVVTDLLLDGRSAETGFSVVSTAKRCEETEVIVVTAYGSPEACARSIGLGAFDYIERGSPGIDFRTMLARKMDLALEYQSARQVIADLKKE